MKLKCVKEDGESRNDLTFSVAKQHYIVSLQKTHQGPYGPVLGFTG